MNTLLINKEDLRHNVNVIKNMAKQTDEKYTVIAVVKGNGYGLGLVEYAKFLIDNGIEFLAIATVEEALELRKAGIKEKILMLSSTSIREDIELLVKNDIILAIGSKESAQIANAIGVSLNKKVKAHLKIDTGMGRYGFLYNDLNTIKSIITENSNIDFEGIFSHFSIAYYKDNKWTKNQYNKLINVINYLEENNIKFKYKHICNSTGFLLYKDMRLNCARIGSAFLGRAAVNCNGLKKIGSIKTKIKEIRTLPKGHNISYLNTYKTKRETRIGIIQIGYIDGINLGTNQDMFRFVDKLRIFYHAAKDLIRKKKITVMINEKRYPVLGKIGMYHMVIDITGTDIKLDDEVLLSVNTLHIDSKVRREYI